MELAVAKLSISTLSPIINKLGSYVYDSYFGGDVTAEDMKKLTNVFLPKIRTVIQEAELVPSDYLRPWLDDLQEAAFEAEDLIDLYEYNKIKYQVSSLPELVKKSIHRTNETLGFMLPKSSLKVSFEKLQKSAEDAESLLPFIKSARRQVKYENPQASTSTSTASTPSSCIFGREKECDIIIKFLLEESHADSNGRIEKIPIIAVQGIGGSGKTSTAQAVYNDKSVEMFDLKMWVHVSRSFDVHRLTKEIIESAVKDGCSHISNLDVLQSKLKESISNGNNFLLVLDDIWCEDKMQWDQLPSPLNEVKGNGSKIIITTRMEKVASILHVDQVVSLEELKMDDCWSILKHYAFGNSETAVEDRELENIGNQIINKVKYSPLALRVVGSLLYKQVSVHEWENIFRRDILKETMDVLLLSFKHLPSHLQRCFAYSSLFPKSYIFCTFRDELIPLWIAQGYVDNTNENKITFEEKGRMYLEELISYSFFNIEKDDNRYYKMHDLFHDLAEKVSKKYYHRITEDSLDVPTTCIHLSVYWMDNFKKIAIPDVSKLKKLRSLIVLDRSYYKNIFENKKDIFQNLAKLRALYVKSEEMEALSYRRISKLKRLRYLNLQCQNKVSELQLAKLYHLQFLYLSGYPRYDFEAYSFPQGFWDLINLRTLKLFDKDSFQVDYWDYYPKLNIEKLTSLRSLDTFHPKKDDVNGMMPLKSLNLEGSLSIRSLENVKSEAEAAKAMLNKKKNLNWLTFEWSDNLNRNKGLNSYENVLEGLEPHPNLETLSIRRYQGVKVSNWMKNENWLPRLRYLKLYRCGSLEELPCLPPRLEKLWVQECNGLMQLPPIGDTLRTLELVECSKLMPPSMPNKSLRLVTLYIRGCAGNENQLFNDLPFLSNLKFLMLKGFSNLQTFPSLSPTVTNLWITGFPKLASMGSLHHYTSLSRLEIEHCPMLTGLEGLQYCTSLFRLEIKCCPMLAGLESLQDCTSLNHLIIRKCHTLMTDVPLLLGKLPCSIKRLDLNGLCRPFTSLVEENLHHLLSLEELTFVDFSTLPSLEKLFSLKRLTIEDCPAVELLPKFPSSLTSLHVENCPCIELLPDFPISMQGIKVKHCPKLKVKYEKGGPLHNTISHIPRLYFY